MKNVKFGDWSFGLLVIALYVFFFHDVLLTSANDDDIDDKCYIEVFVVPF